MAPLTKDYDTFLFYKLNEHSAPEIDVFTVLIEDMGPDCMCIREPLSSQVIVLILKIPQGKPRWNPEVVAGEGVDGFAPGERPSESEGRLYLNILHPFGVSVPPFPYFLWLTRRKTSPLVSF